MVEFLSPEWLRELDAAARASSTLRGLGREGSFVVEQRVQGGPDGDVTYHLVVEAQGARVVPGPAPAPHLTVTTDVDTALALHRGAISGHAALVAGSLTVGGDLNEVLRRADVLRAIDDVFGRLRATTSTGGT